MCSLFTAVNPIFAQGTAFTYNGRLSDGGSPANGHYDLTFSLFDADSGPTQVGSTLTNSATVVSNGLFTATLDFGAGVFTGANRWLEISVRTNGGGALTTLIPRNAIMPTPYAIYSANAAAAATAATANSVYAAGIVGTVQLTQLPGTILTNNQNGVNLTGTFTGNGASLTNLNAVAKTGDTMTGTLNLPANGLVAGTLELLSWFFPVANSESGRPARLPSCMSEEEPDSLWLTLDLSSCSLELAGVVRPETGKYTSP